MAKKLKNAGKLKGFFLSHGEKLVIAAVAGVAGWLVYSSLGGEVETKRPNELTQLVNEARGRIDRFGWPAALESENPPPVAESFQAAVAEEVKADSYATSPNAYREVLPPTLLRKDPVLLPPVELEGRGFTELIAFFSDAAAKERALKELLEQEEKARQRELERERSQSEDARRGGRGRGRDEQSLVDERGRRITGSRRRQFGSSLSGREDVKIQPVAVVLAKAPVEEQLKLYRDVFENALGYDPDRDVPQYLGYFVERREVRGDEELEWRKLNIRNGLKPDKKLAAVTENAINDSIADWAQSGEELVDGRYYHPALTFPLPPRVGRTWDREVVHSGVPLAIEAELAEQEEAEQEEDDSEASPDEDLFGGGVASGRGGTRNRRGGQGGFGGERGFAGGPTGFGGFGGGEEFGGGFGGGFGAGGFGGGGFAGGGFGGGRRSGGRGRSGGQFGFEVPHAMIRLIDFDVKPGRRYQYRFKLVLLDANGKGLVSSAHLDGDVRKRVGESKSKGTPRVLSDWSEPSPPISIPLAGKVRMAAAQPSATGERTATLVIESFDFDETGDAIQASIEKEKLRIGSVMNSVERDYEIIKENFLVKVEQFNFRTNITLVDVQGGDKLGRDMTAPGSVLLMDAAGKLSVRDQLKDYEDVQTHRDTYAEEEDGRNSYGGGGEYGAGGFFEFE